MTSRHEIVSKGPRSRDRQGVTLVHSLPTRSLPDGRGSDYKRSTGAFTLIELLVVIGIIIILMAILLPALSAVRNQAYRTQTAAELAGLNSNIEVYFTDYDAYPGPEPSAVTSATSGAKMSGTQNLLIALTYSIYNPKPTKNLPTGWNPLAMPDGGAYVDFGNPDGPQDLSRSPVQAHAPYYNPSSKELSPNSSGSTTAWPAGGVVGCAGSGFAGPTILDRFPDALPILYFRKTPSVDSQVTFDAKYNPSQPGTPKMVSESYSATTPSSFYRADNSEYLDSPGLTSLSGTVYPQAGVSGFSSPGVTTPTAISPADGLAGAIAGPNYASTVISAHGGFVLMSASTDRVYGPNTKKANKNDDVINIGGH